jgi:hypothetical protein
LQGSPYVVVEPVARAEGPVTLANGFLLFAPGRIHVYARGDCAVKIVLQRDPRDLQPLSMSARGVAHVDVSNRRVVIEVPPGKDHTIVPLETTRYDGWPFTDINTGSAGYDCSWKGDAAAAGAG